METDTYAYWAAERSRQGRTLERSYRELRGDSLTERRQIQIDNLKFRLDHVTELGLTDRKVERMQTALRFQEAAQLRAVVPADNNLGIEAQSNSTS